MTARTSRSHAQQTNWIELQDRRGQTSHFVNRSRRMAGVLVAAVLSHAFVAMPVVGQTQASRNLDRKAEEMQKQFLEGLDQLAEEYVEAGLHERARDVLQRRQKIDRSDDVKAKLEALDERDFELNQLEMSITASGGWTDSGLSVTEGEEIRIEAGGQIRVILNSEIGPGGLPLEGDVENVPAGSLVAIIAPPREGRNKPEPTKPIVVGTTKQFDPPKSGRLFLRIAAPTGAKVVGDFDVRISGKIKPASAARPATSRPPVGRPRR